MESSWWELPLASWSHRVGCRMLSLSPRTGSGWCAEDEPSCLLGTVQKALQQLKDRSMVVTFLRCLTSTSFSRKSWLLMSRYLPHILFGREATHPTSASTLLRVL